MRVRQPEVPFSPSTGLRLSLPVLEPAGLSTLLNSPPSHLQGFITPNPYFSAPPSLEWDDVGIELQAAYQRKEALARVVAGIEGLVDREQWLKKPSVTDPHFVDQDKIQLVTTEEPSLEENSLFDSKEFDSSSGG